ncbi:STAS domain-containing protein [Oscillatoria sp. FACHB-1406]|uniref:STAS domain-containing protein n=1 Tax=Oscillatoria sp. FACHB-1406 TaxID=2692846 RepID=UPI001686B8E4|nr:STAS domain-containing protein [Oscillatoria sp. FACHB-1406]MBD2579881.1 STAS domain-containing protein [Oscillatoria sp. FACHB-1406]
MNFVLHLRGTLDFPTAFLVQQQLNQWADNQPIPPGSRWIIDFIGVERVSVSGLFIFSELFRLAARKQCTLRLCNLTLPAGMRLQLQYASPKTKVWQPIPSRSLPIPRTLGVSQQFARIRQRLIAAEQLRGGEAAVSGYAFKTSNTDAQTQF